VYITDLTGDGKNDVIVNIAYPDPSSITNPVKIFVVWIYVCASTDYARVYETQYPQISTALDPGMYIDQIRDLNHDSLPEVIHHSVSCGVNICYETLGIVEWNSTLQQMHRVLSDDFPLGEYGSVDFVDLEGDGIFDVVVTSGVAGSAGAGPQRHWQTTYGWDGVNFTQRRSVPELPRLQFEAAQDAATALNVGDLQTAAILYQRILNDPTLSGIDAHTDAIVKTQALFGLLVIRTSQQDKESAEAIYQELQNAPAIPDEISLSTNTHFSESLWVQVGRTFHSQVRGYYLGDACDAVIAELNAALDGESPGNRSSYWGNWGGAPRPEDICPF
jgi:hypothetical protein